MFKDLDKRTAFDVGVASFVMIAILFGFCGFFTTITHILEFIILIEVVRTVSSYIIDNNHHMSIRFIVDGAIVFMVRELILLMATPNAEKTYIVFKLTSIVLVLFSLFLFRIAAIRYSPENKEFKSNEANREG